MRISKKPWKIKTGPAVTEPKNSKNWKSQEVISVDKKEMGRPALAPKTKPRQVRLDDECSQILGKYCIRENIPHSEGIRRGIKMIKLDLKTTSQ